MIKNGATALDIQNALNDLPILSPNLATVTQITTSGNIRYSVKFSADLGDVPLMVETSGNVNILTTKITAGVPTGNKIQVLIQNQTSNLFNIKDTAANVSP